MKKNLMGKMSFLLVLMLVAALASGCGKSTDTNNNASESTEAQVSESSETSEAAGTEVSGTTEAATETAAAEAASTEAIEYQQVGEGDTKFYFVATDADGNSTYWEVSTNETTVGAALLALDMIAGDDSDYGLYVKTVNGITADYDQDGTYWAFYIDGEYASTGVDATDITAGSTYTFAVEK